MQFFCLKTENHNMYAYAKMATRILYTYLIETSKVSLYIFENIALKSIFINFKDLENSVTYHLLAGDNTLHLDHATLEGKKILAKPFHLSFEDFLKRFNAFEVVSYTFCPEFKIVSTEEIIDWSETISYLETYDVVKTKESKNLLALDPRKFWLSTEDEDTAIDVDCLGTKIFQQENKNIADLYHRLK